MKESISGSAKILNKYLNQNLDIHIQFYNLLAIIGMSVGIVAAIINFMIKEQVSTIIIDLIIALMSFVLLTIAEKWKCYLICNRAAVIIMFIIIFPLLFFSYGGYKSGASCFFVVAVIFTAHLLDKSERIAALAGELVIYVFCLLTTYYLPQTTVVLAANHTHIYILDTILNFILSCIVLLLAFTLRTSMINIRQTQIQELNRELIARNETLAQYDKMKSDFLATVAHEINTPLAIIAASSSDTLDLLKESPLNMNEITGNQMIIEKRVKLIDNIMTDLMDTVAIENGRLSLTRLPTQMSELIRNICDAQLSRPDANGNQVVYDFEQGLPPIWADPMRIEQVMTNLLSNAFRHTTNGIITIKLTRADSSQIVSVTDNGEGMDSETARIVLKQYVSTKADYWRHGIGLYICRRIVTAHGGEIWIDSKKGRGTTVSFSLKEEESL